MTKYTPEQRLAKFWSHVEKTNSDTCWLWTGHKIKQGYGHTFWFGKMMLAHRIAWELAHGSIPDGLDVCHSCDEPSCVNVAHLWLGTHADNMRDKKNKGRGVYVTGQQHWTHTHPEKRATGSRSGAYTHPECRARGERNGKRTHPEKITYGEENGNSRFSDADIVAIRERYAAGDTLVVIGKNFGVGHSYVSRIVRRQVWKHI